MVVCKICGSDSNRVFSKTILKKYHTDFYRCTNCSFIQTDQPIWLREAYSDAISEMDTGILVRNQKYSRIVPLIINTYFNQKARFLDYGAGYGIFVRMMRDKGIDFYWKDEFCENIFAKRFDVSLLKNDHSIFEVITAFEVFEHLQDPVAELQKILEFGDSILFSTTIIPNRSIDELQNWWYLSPETGQHIALYSLKSLEILGNKYGLNFYSNGYNFHLLTKKTINPFIFHGLWIFKKTMLALKGSGNDLDSGYKLDRETYKNSTFVSF